MSCGQCIRKVLKAAEPLTKHTLARKRTHTVTYTQSHTATPRHHLPPSHSRDQDKGTFNHTRFGTHTQGHTKPIPTQSQCTLQDAHVHLKCQGNSHSLRDTKPPIVNRCTQGGPHPNTNTHSVTQILTLTILGSTQIFSYVLLQLPNTHIIPVHSLAQHTHRNTFTLTRIRVLTQTPTMTATERHSTPRHTHTTAHSRPTGPTCDY